ncbi:MAG: hypothetical protein Q4C23_01365 [Mycoplasmatota bacterium]|nr:hypothetical protein [Mycoplasmatota bacterium]
MKIINNKIVQVYTSEELSSVLESENEYEYIYLGNDITLEKGITINNNKEKVTIDGTYTNIKFKLTGMNSNASTDTIIASPNNKEIKIKNMDIEYTNNYGVVYAPAESLYKDVAVTYENINFLGTQLSFNPFGTTQIIGSIINIEDTNSITAGEVCESSRVIIGGNTTISSKATTCPLFIFRNDPPNISMIFLCKSNINIYTDTKELMNGTNKLNFTILHDTEVNIITGNGFSVYSTTGANNVLIDERASLKIIEKSHQRVPMWNIFGTLTMKEGSTLQLINSYKDTPIDNYNIYFKGNNPQINLDNPKEILIYTKNANVIYTNNPITYKIKCCRINFWNDSQELTSAGGISNLPDYYWYKNDDLLELTGTITQTETSITTHNLTEEELANLPSLDNFKFQSKKQFSIGAIKTNIHPLNNTQDTISGHTSSFADVLIKYNGNTEIVTAEEDGFFKYDLTTSIPDNTEIEFISNIPNSFLYETRKITTPFNGELSLMDTDNSLSFSLIPINNSKIFPRTKKIVISVVDSRLNSSNWRLFAYIDTPLTSLSGYLLEDALIFKKLTNENIILNETPQLVFQGVDTGGNPNKIDLTFSEEKGPLLDLTNNALVANEEYFANIIWTIEE